MKRGFELRADDQLSCEYAKPLDEQQARILMYDPIRRLVGVTILHAFSKASSVYWVAVHHRDRTAPNVYRTMTALRTQPRRGVG
jgi:hypothetical protein